jgi:hypothetical protein
VEETEDQRAPAEVTAAQVGHWLDEEIDLARLYAEIWKDAAPTHLVDVAVFCDSDGTHTASTAILPICGLNGAKALYSLSSSAR